MRNFNDWIKLVIEVETDIDVKDYYKVNNIYILKNENAGLIKELIKKNPLMDYKSFKEVIKNTKIVKKIKRDINSLMSVRQVAEHFNCSKQNIYKKINNKTIPFIKIDGKYFIYKNGWVKGDNNE